MGPRSTVAIPIGTNDAYAANVSALAEIEALGVWERGMNRLARNGATISEEPLLGRGRRLRSRFPHYQLRLDRDLGRIIFLSLNSFQQTLRRHLSHSI